MHEIIIQAIAKGGYVGIFLLMALENIIPPIPSEVIMGLGGVLVARGQMQFWILLAVGTVGSTAGNYFWYWVGNKYGYRRLGDFVARHGRWFTVDYRQIEKAARFFQRHGQWVVFGLRFSPFLRTMVSLPAGLAHMSVWRFLIFTFAGTAVWNAVLIEGGRQIAPLFDKYKSLASLIVVVLMAAIVLWYVYRVVTWKPSEDDS